MLKRFIESRPIRISFVQTFLVLELPVYEHMHLEENLITSLNNNDLAGVERNTNSN